MAIVASGSACNHDDGDATSDTISEIGSPNPGPLPTLQGGITLPATDVTTLLTGQGLMYGTPLPSHAAAAAAFEKDPEVKGQLARTVRGAGSGVYVADVVMLRLDGTQIFDASVLDAFVQGVVSTAGGTEAVLQPVGDVRTFTAMGREQTAAGYQIGDLVVLVTAPTAAAVRAVVDRQLAARAAGQHGAEAPATPLLPALPIATAYVPVPSVSFVPFPPPEQEESPAPPPLPNVVGVDGRYGVVAGERRTTAWVYALDAGAYPVAERVYPALSSVVSSVAGGAKARTTEVVDRIVFAADPPDDVEPPDPADPDAVEPLVARAFLHGSLAIVVTGRKAAEVDAAVSDWISHLTTP
jgi:hypothetical protein